MSNDTMNGLRGMSSQEARSLCREQMQRAGIPQEHLRHVQQRDWAVAVAIANEAHKQGAREMQAIMVGVLQAAVVMIEECIKEKKIANQPMPLVEDKAVNPDYAEYMAKHAKVEATDPPYGFKLCSDCPPSSHLAPMRCQGCPRRPYGFSTASNP